MASVGSISPSPATADDQLPSDECEYEWFVAKIDDIDLSIPSNPVVAFEVGTEAMDGSVSNGFGWNSLTTSFPQYNDAGTPDIGFPTNGNFGDGFYYIALTVYDCDCYADSTDAKIVGRLGFNRVLNEVPTTFTLSKESLLRMEQVRSNYRNGTIEQTTSSLLEHNTFLNKERDRASLAQNEPNPFDNSTSISYFLPVASQSAELRITGIDGSVLQMYPLDQRGHGKVRINATQYREGIYFYSLVIDDRVVETKRMVLTR